MIAEQEPMLYGSSVASMKTLRELQQRTKLSLAECNRALAQGSGTIDGALKWLGAQGMIQGKSFDCLKNEILNLAEEWAKRFLEETNETGELAEYDAKGELEMIQENYYHWYIAGTPSSYHHVLKSDLAALPDEQQDELEEVAYDAYAGWVARLLSDYA